MNIDAEVLAKKERALKEAHPLLNQLKNKIIVVYCAGDILDDSTLLDDFAVDIALLQRAGIHPIIVHGGDQQISARLKAMDIYSIHRLGIRVTDAQTMEIVSAELTKINRTLVEVINEAGGTAKALNTTDSKLISAQKLKIRSEYDPFEFVDLGLSGEIECIDYEVVLSYCRSGIVPVVMPVGFDNDGEPLNVNARQVAAKLAKQTGAEKLVFITNLRPLADQNGRIVGEVAIQEMQWLFDYGQLPYALYNLLEPALTAVSTGVKAFYIIEGHKKSALLNGVFSDENNCTIIRSNGSPRFFSDSLRYFDASFNGNFDGPEVIFHGI